MILGRTLKQVVVGAAALGCLQRASCELFKSDAKEIKSYWTDRISYFNKEINLRSGLFKKVGALDATEEAVNSEHSSEENTKIKEAMDAVVAEDFETFTNKSLEIINLADTIISTYDDYLNNKAFSFDEAQKEALNAKITADKKLLGELIIPALDMSTLLAKRITIYDSYMLNAIVENYPSSKSAMLSDLTLFKLAKSKIVAADIIYALSEINPSDLCSNENMKYYLVESIHEKVTSHVISKSNIELFVNCIRKDIIESSANILVSASKYFHLLFNIYPMGGYDVPLVDNEIMNLYISLIDESLSEEKVNEYVYTIMPNQIVKVIVIEYVMSGRLIDYKNNALFRNLRKIIENAFDPVKFNRMDLNTYIDEIVEQDEILDALCVVWGDFNTRGGRHQKEMELCRNIGIEHSNFEKIHSDIITVRWMYEGVMAPSANLRVPLDISYMHPAWYVLMRFKSIDSLDANDSDNSDLLTKTAHGGVLLRPHVIKVTNNEFIWAQYMRDCIRACFSDSVRIIERRDDNRKYSKLISNFSRYLSIGNEKGGSRVEYEPSKSGQQK